MSKKPIAIGLLAILSLSACATVSPEARVRDKLMQAGLSPRMSACMAERMVDRLSIAQLKRLQSLVSLRDADYQTLTIDRLLHKLRAIDDPEIFTVVSRAGLACAIAP
jgi:hypothetical protein